MDSDAQMMSEMERIGRAHAERRRSIVDFMAQYDLALLRSTFAASLAEYKAANPLTPQVEAYLLACMDSNHLLHAREVIGTGHAIREIQETLAYLERDRDPEEEAVPSLAKRVMEFLQVFHRKVITNLIANTLAMLDEGKQPSDEVYEKAYCRTVDQIGGIAAIERFYMRARSFTREILDLLDRESDARDAPEPLQMTRALLQIERIRAGKEFEHYQTLYGKGRLGTNGPGLPSKEAGGGPIGS